MLVAIPATLIFWGANHHMDKSETVDVVKTNMDDIPANFQIIMITKDN